MLDLRAQAVLSALLLSTACGGGSTTECADGRVCPVGLVCDIAHETCVQPQDIRACDGVSDGTVCDSHDVAASCDRGVCVIDQCGDTIVGASEGCDDGNITDNDGCSSLCVQESCGNGIVEEGEQCDCGGDGTRNPSCLAINSDEPGAECRTDCVLHCGDGVVNAAEECDTAAPGIRCSDFGFAFGALSCNSQCREDLAPCGHIGFRPVSLPIVTGPGAGYFGFDGTGRDDIWAGGVGVSNDGGGDRYKPIVSRFNGFAWVQETPVQQDIGGFDDIARSPDHVVGVGCVRTACVGDGCTGSSCTLGLVLVRTDAGWYLDGDDYAEPFTDVVATPQGEFFALAGRDIWRADPAALNETQTKSFGVSYAGEDGMVWRGLAADGSDNVWVVGGESAGVALHFDGADWVERSAGLPLPMETVDVLGDFVVASSTNGTLYRYSDGNDSWEFLASLGGIRGIAIRAQDEVLAVSALGRTYIYDGQRFRLTAASASGFFDAKLIGDDLWSLSTSRVLRYTGTFASNELALDSRDVWVSPSGSVFALALGSVVVDDGTISQCVVNPCPVATELNFLWGRSDTDVFAAGDGLFRFHNGVWSEECSDVSPSVGALWGNQNLVFFNSGRTVYSFDGSQCTPVAPALTGRIAGIWASESGDLFVLAKDELLQLASDGTWSPLGAFDFAATNVFGVADGAGLSLWVVGNQGRIDAYRDGAWRSELSVAVGSLNDVHGTSANDVFALARNSNELVHWDGNAWSLVDTTDLRVSGLWVTERVVSLAGAETYQIVRTTPWWSAP